LLDAQRDLAAREGTSERNIRAVAVNTTDSDDVSRRIHAWLVSKRLAGAVWTALPSNWQDRRGCSYTDEDAVNYLSGLTGEQAARARAYVEKAPKQIRTRARMLFQTKLGWRLPPSCTMEG
jgi:hypothetical protein